MAEEKKEVPKHIKSFYDKQNKLEQLLESTNVAHSQAYHSALDVIKDEKTGLYNHKRLDDVKTQDQFLDKMMGSYMSFAMERLGIKDKPKDEFEQDIIMQKYIGVTKSQLREQMRKAKGNYKLQTHEKIRDQLVKQQEKEMKPLISNHFEKKHLDDILTHTGADKYINKDTIQIGHAAGLLEMYKHAGQLNVYDLKENGFEDVLTKSAKDSLKEMKDNYKKAA